MRSKVRMLTLVAGVALVAAACGGPGTSGTGSPPPNGQATSTAAPTATAESSTGTATFVSAKDLDQPLEPGRFRVAEPFEVPFSVTFASSWTPRTLAHGDVQFVASAPRTGAGWLVVQLVENVFVDPCHDTSPATPAVPSTVDGIVTALAGMRGFEAGPVRDVVVGGHKGKYVEVVNQIETDTENCAGGPMVSMWTVHGSSPAATNAGATEHLWVIDVDGTLVLVDAETGLTTPPAQLGELGAMVTSISFGSDGPQPASSVWPLTTPARATGSISGRFDIGGRSLFIECRGTGPQTVVFLMGTDAPRNQLRSIEDRLLSRPVRVCDYDRPGEGQSDPVATQQTDVEIVDDLAKLLSAAKVPTPYVLVGHSVGGDQAWLYAGRHPKGLGGFLLMNAGFFELDWDRVKTVWTDAEIAEERAASEAGLGHVKQTTSPPDGVPYVVMLSTVAQCGSTTDICGRIYPFYEAWARELAGRTRSGRFVEVEAPHTIFEGHVPEIMVELNSLLDDVR